MISTPAPSVIVDTNILYPAGIRDILFRVAETDIYRLKWSPDIRRELISMIRKVRPGLDHAQFERHTLGLMDKFFHHNLVTEYEHYIDDLEGTHVKDRHVAAAELKYFAYLLA